VSLEKARRSSSNCRRRAARRGSAGRGTGGRRARSTIAQVSGDPDPTAAIELEGVVKQFGSERALAGVDLAVSRGAITVLLGPSGAGKTVTVNHIVGLIYPTAGVVRVDGKDLAALSDEELNEVRRGMSVAMQGNQPFTCGLFFSLNVYQNVAFPLRDRTGWAPERVGKVTLDHLAMVGLKDRASYMPDQLSSGERKRTALARALALNAHIVIIDDFDSGIDGVRLALLCELIKDVHDATGATFLVTTHDMAAARQLADHVAVIHEGHIVESGEADAVFRSDEPVARQLISGALSGPIRLEDV
jgi:phospholipid/cholesterol/gamma-HCH transport system ATP-binding protein